MYSEYVSTAFDTSSPACAAAGGGSLTTSPGGISWPQLDLVAAQLRIFLDLSPLKQEGFYLVKPSGLRIS